MHAVLQHEICAIFACHQTSNHANSYLPVCMLNLSTEEPCVISGLIEEEENVQNSEKRKRKRVSVHKMHIKRKTEGEYWTVDKELMNDDKFFFNIFVYLSIGLVSCWIKKNQSVITKEDTVFNEARWKCTWMYMNTTGNHSYCTYCYRCGPARHVQTRSISAKYSLQEFRTETDCTTSCRKRFKHGVNECIYKYSTKEYLSYRKRYLYETMNAG
jgi:hypothetical protein